MSAAAHIRGLDPEAGRSLVIVMTDDTTAMARHLKGWSDAGLLGRVLLCSRDLLAGRSNTTVCEGNISGQWAETEFPQALYQARLKWLVIASLRPQLPVPGPAATQAYTDEERSLGNIRERFRAVDCEMRSVTVSVLGAESSVGYDAFSPIWDLHLVHDSDVIAASSLPAQGIEADMDASGHASLCALTALTISGGWSFAREVLIEPDRGDAAIKPVRVARPQVRAVFAGQLLRDASMGLLPLAPPWPLPEDSGGQRAAAGAVPPPQTAEAVCRGLGFALEPFSPAPQERTAFGWRMRAAWRAMTDWVDPPAAVSTAEVELQELQDRLEEHRWDADVAVAQQAAAMARDLERAGLTELIGGTPRDPVRWAELRSLAFCLVDGGELPGDVARQFALPVDGEGARLIWTDPSSIVPAPHSGTVDGDGRYRLSMESTDPDETLLGRVRERLSAAAQSAAQHCTEDDRDMNAESHAYENAAVQLTKLRRWRNLVAALIVLAVVVTSERLIGPVGALARGVGLETLGPLTSTPLVDAIVGAVVATFLISALAAAAWRAGAATLRHYDHQRLRRWKADARRHYAIEAARLCSAALEFEDHERIIATMLHRPYTTGSLDASIRLDVHEVPHPAPMMLAIATAAPQRLAALRRLERAATVRKGWISSVFAATYDRWKAEFESAVSGKYEDPDDDHTHRGETRYSDARTSEPLPGAREHFADAIADDDGFRRSVTATAVGDLLGTDVDAMARRLGSPHGLVDLLGNVAVPNAPALDGLPVAKFLNLSSETDKLNWSLLRPGILPPRVDIRGSQTPREVPDAPGRPEALIASWRMLISEPLQASDLRCWSAETSGWPEEQQIAEPRPAIV